jgi:hypothetical protein
VSDKYVNGVNVGASPSYPTDWLCPTCREPFSGVEMSSTVLIEHLDGTKQAVQGMPVGPYFTPCKHDARSCFPPAPKAN